VVGVYTKAQGAEGVRFRSAFVLLSTCNMLGFFAQTVAVFGSFTFEWPEQLDLLFDIARIFLLDLQGLSFSCAWNDYGDTFGVQYTSIVMLPLGIVGLVGVTYGATHLLAQVGVLEATSDKVMQVNRTLNMLGMVVNALYVTLVKMVSAYFECTSNPGDGTPKTLAKYRYVECDGSLPAGGEAIGAMIFGMAFYVVGIYALFAYGVQKCPSSKHLKEYRECWTFMWYRWRSDCYFWGMVVMTRNLLVAFTAVMSEEPRTQLLLAVTVIMICSLLTAAYHPWCAEMLNWYDMSTCFVLILIGLFGIVFLSLQNEILFHKRHMLYAEADAMHEELSDYAHALLVAICLFCAEFVVLVLWCVQLMRPNVRKEVIQKELEELRNLNDNIGKETENRSVDQAVWEAYLGKSDEHDRSNLFRILAKVAAERSRMATGETGKPVEIEA